MFHCHLPNIKIGISTHYYVPTVIFVSFVARQFYICSRLPSQNNNVMVSAAPLLTPHKITSLFLTTLLQYCRYLFYYDNKLWNNISTKKIYIPVLCEFFLSHHKNVNCQNAVAALKNNPPSWLIWLIRPVLPLSTACNVFFNGSEYIIKAHVSMCKKNCTTIALHVFQYKIRYPVNLLIIIILLNFIIQTCINP